MPRISNKPPLSTRRPQSAVRTRLVKRGESLKAVAKKWGVSVRALLTANRLTRDEIVKNDAGVWLFRTEVKLVHPDDGQRHVVRRGDTIAKLAREGEYGAYGEYDAGAGPEVREMLGYARRHNRGFDPKKMRIGQVLVLPPHPDRIAAARVKVPPRPVTAPRPLLPEAQHQAWMTFLEAVLGDSDPRTETQDAVLQHALNLVRWAGDGWPQDALVVDGDWGAKSKAMLRAFERHHKLPEDGVVDPRVLAKIREAMPAPRAWVTLEPEYRLAEITVQASEAPDIAALGVVLRDIRKMADAGGFGVLFNGEAGRWSVWPPNPQGRRDTIKALRAFQALVGLDVDGVAGESTLKAIGRHVPLWEPGPIQVNTLIGMRTTGASAATSKGTKLHGAQASRCLAGMDWNGNRMRPIVQTTLGTMRDTRNVGAIKKIAKAHQVPPALVAALISRESRAGSLLDKQGWGDKGNAFGVLQVDARHHDGLRGTNDPWSYDHLDQAMGVFRTYHRRLSVWFPKASASQILMATIAAYNRGDSGVRRDILEHGFDGVDVETTMGDYANDVVARAKYFAEVFLDG